MAIDERSPILAFLYKVIDDNQSTIRFLDTKAAFGIAVLGAMVGKVLDREQLIAFASHGLFTLVVAIIFAALVVLGAVLGCKTVFPTINPAENVSFPDNLNPKFFIARFRDKSWLRLFLSKKNFATLAMTHAEYCDALTAADAVKLEAILAAEVLKLSFIRQLKTDGLTAFANALILSVLLFVFLTIAAPKPPLTTTPPQPIAVSVPPIQCVTTLPSNSSSQMGGAKIKPVQKPSKTGNP